MIMNREINGITDVKEFAALLVREGVAFYPRLKTLSVH